MRFAVGAFLFSAILPACALAQDGPLNRAIARAASTAVPERNDPGGWSAVVRLHLGTKIAVTYMDGGTEDRLFMGANDSKLMVRDASVQAGVAEIISKERVREIAVERRYRPAGAAVAAGTALGVVIALFIEKAPAGLKVMWAPIGALVGYSMSPVHTTRKVIYRANP